MKKLIYAVVIGAALLISGNTRANAADGMHVFEAATSSWNVHVVTLSTVTAQQVTIGTNTVSDDYMDPTGYKRIQWYSHTIWNLTSSTAVYKMAPMYNNDGTAADTDPGVSCSVDAPIGMGDPTSAVSITEQTVGMKMWILACTAGSAPDMKIGQRGR